MFSNSLLLLTLHLSAVPLDKILQDVSGTTLTYKGKGQIFGYVSTESCLYSARDLLILKHYCFPVRKYPAQGYTVISKSFGMIEVYEENLPTAQKREIYYMQFAENLSPYLPDSLEDFRIKGTSDLLQKLYYKNYPACWSTNYSDGSGKKESRCTIDSGAVDGIDVWFTEAERTVEKEETWSSLLSILRKTN